MLWRSSNDITSDQRNSAASFLKETPTQVFFCEYCKIFKNSLINKTPGVTAFV